MNTTEYKWPEGEKLIFVRPPNEEYTGNLDYFYAPELFPEILKLKDHWQEIRDEILDYEKAHGGMGGFSSLTAANVKGGKWTLLYLKSFKRNYKKNRAKFPKTAALIDSIPNIVFAAVSRLPAGTHITPHFGDTNGIVRSHLGLVIPAESPTTAIRIGTETRGWQEGELMCFLNVHNHEAWNKSEKDRYVLMFDFVPKNINHSVLEVCSKGLGSQSHNFLYTRLKLYRLLPESIINLNILIYTMIWKIYLLMTSKGIRKA